MVDQCTFVFFDLQIVNFSKPAMIPPQSTVTPFFVRFLANASDLAFSTILRVYTNASIFTVPIHCFDGKLKVSFVSLLFSSDQHQISPYNITV